MRIPQTATAIVRSAMATLLALILVGMTAEPARGELKENSYANGQVRTRWQVRQTAEGALERHGFFIRFHANGRIALRGLYRANAPAGIWTWYDKDGEPVRRMARSADQDEPIDRGEVLSPKTRFRDPSGATRSEGQLKYDKPHGFWQYYYRDGSPKAFGDFVTGIPEGSWTFLHPNGQIAKNEHYRLGILHGTFREAFDNGQESILGDFDQGLRAGLWRTWYLNGQLKSSGSYIEDLREGEWIFYEQDGTLRSRVIYKRNTIVQTLPPRPEDLRRRPNVYTATNPFRPRIYDEDGHRIRRPGAKSPPPASRVKRRSKRLR